MNHFFANIGKKIRDVNEKSITFYLMFTVPELQAIWTSPLNSHLGLVIMVSSCSFSVPCQKLLFPTYTTIIVYLITTETRSVCNTTICLSTACGTKYILHWTEWTIQEKESTTPLCETSNERHLFSRVWQFLRFRFHIFLFFFFFSSFKQQ